jgi:RNA polymerase sigma factor (sigma-70 family)
MVKTLGYRIMKVKIQTKLNTQTNHAIPHDLNHDEIVQKLQELHERSWKWCLFCCDGIVDEAEDLLQEAYVYVLGRQADYQGKSNVKTWFFGVIRFLSYNYTRKKRSRLQRLKLAVNSWSVLGHWSLGTHNSDMHTAELEIDDYKLRIQQAITQLSVAQRHVVELVFYQDLTLHECADVMNISIGSVRTHYARAKKKLVHLLQNNEVHV